MRYVQGEFLTCPPIFTHHRLDILMDAILYVSCGGHYSLAHLRMSLPLGNTPAVWSRAFLIKQFR
jgi:hypothetical protein